MMSHYFFSTPVDIDIVLEDSDERETVDIKLDKNRREKTPLYMDGESVKGTVTVRPKDGKRLEHAGIKVQFIGLIGLGYLSTLPSWLPRCLAPGRISIDTGITTRNVFRSR
jgi:vacuolar protein sorting-associated protein 26